MITVKLILKVVEDEIWLERVVELPDSILAIPDVVLNFATDYNSSSLLDEFTVDTYNIRYNIFTNVCEVFVLMPQSEFSDDALIIEELIKRGWRREE